ncbi:hypothetical protein BHE74_00020578 [Ensete ventricosum]|nr:hypothetical protein BHE74_00020578 [Ensete ventricosum]
MTNRRVVMVESTLKHDRIAAKASEAPESTRVAPPDDERAMVDLELCNAIDFLNISKLALSLAQGLSVPNISRQALNLAQGLSVPNIPKRALSLAQGLSVSNIPKRVLSLA